MIDRQVIVDEDSARKAADKIGSFLSGRHFFVVSVHSNHFSDVSVLEDRTIGGPYQIIGRMCSIPLLPKRQLSFEIAPTTIITFESSDQLIIERQVSARDWLKRIVLIAY